MSLGTHWNQSAATRTAALTANAPIELKVGKATGKTTSPASDTTDAAVATGVHQLSEASP
jgi:hypothetical protein